MPKEPHNSRPNKKAGDTVTRNIVIGMVVLVVAIGVIFTFMSKRTSESAALPSAINKIDTSKNGASLIGEVSKDSDYGISFNTAATPKIDIFEDFQCPFCMHFETSMSTYLEDLIRQKQAAVTFHMVSFIGEDSVRAANAANCAVDQGRFIEYHRALYAIQGAENTGIYSNSNLIEVGKRLGITDPKFEKCVTGGTYADVVKNVNNSMGKYNVNGTPTVFINGKVWNRSGNDFVLDEFKSAVEAAKK